MKDKEYLNKVIEAAISKLKDAKKPLSELEITSGIVGRLKKKIGQNDKRHSSKIRFRGVTFKEAIDTKEWTKSILQLSDKKYILKEEESIYSVKESSNQWDWCDVDYEKAIEYKLNNLKKVDPYKLEVLVSNLLEKIYSEFEFEVTKKSGDLGIDVKGHKIDSTNKREAIYVQVKKFNKTVGREYADQFVGALNGSLKKNRYSRLTGLFITTGRYPDSFIDKLRDSQDKSISFACWDGTELSRQMLKNGLGIKYSIDKDFWKNFDSTAVLMSNKVTKKKTTVKKKKTS